MTLSIGSADGSDARLYIAAKRLGDGFDWAYNDIEENSWSSVAYGDGLFVAVSSSGDNRVAISADGIDWTPQSAAENNSWRSVAYGDGLFVAVSSGGTNRVMTSSDGITWTPQSAAENNQWRHVIYGDGLFVAVSSSGTNRVMTSPDGITWTSHALPTDHYFHNLQGIITYGNGKYLATGYDNVSGDNVILSSSDGATWTASAVPSDTEFYHIAYGDGKFVTVGFDYDNGNSASMTSTDGINWALHTITDSVDWSSLTYTNGLFVATVSRNDGANIMISEDGIDWEVYTGSEFVSSVTTYGNGLYVAISDDTDQIVTSTGANTLALEVDGTVILNGSTTVGGNLDIQNDLQVGGESYLNGNLYLDGSLEVYGAANIDSISAGSLEVTGNTSLYGAANIIQTSSTTAFDIQNGSGSSLLFNANTASMSVGIGQPAGSDARLSVSDGGGIMRIWSSNPLLEVNSWLDLAYGNGLFVAVSFNGGVMTSPDGITWTARTAAEANDWRSIAYGNGLFVAVSSNGTNQVMTSPDGITWTARAASYPLSYCSVSYANDLFIATSNCWSGITNGFMTSPDGINWTTRTFPTWVTGAKVAYGNGLYVAMTWNSTVLTSLDGINWTDHGSIGYELHAEKIIYNDGLFVAVGGYDGITTSTDGVSWTEPVASDIANYISIAYGDGIYVATASYASQEFFDSRVVTSSDAINWTTAGENLYGSGVAFGDDEIVVLAEDIAIVGTSIDFAALHVDGRTVINGNTTVNSELIVNDSTSLFGNTSVTTDSTTAFQIQNASSTPVFTVDTATNNITLGAATSLTLTGGNTASRPASPTEGMVYFDSQTDQLLTYANGKWQADRTDSVLVAASNSSQNDKDAADFVADGNTGTAADGDQVQINAALTAGSGKKVVLLAGTYTVDASVSVPNNTTLTGIGNGTLLTIPNSFNANLNVITNTDAATGTGVVIRDLVVDGNKANQASGDQIGVYLDDMGTLSTGVVGATIRDIVAKNLTRGGVNLFSSELTTISNITVLSIDSYAIDISGNSSNANKIVGNTVKDSNYGIFLGWGENNVVTNNILDSNDYGIYSSAYRSTISNNTFRSNERAIFLEAATHNVVEGNVIYNSTLDGIYITSASNNIINENILQDNGGATANNAIYLTASDNNTITDNSITDSSASTTNYPININNSSSDNNYLSGNKFTSTPGTSTIRDIGTGTRFASQSVAEGGLNMLYKQTASATAFQVQNASAAALFTADSTNNRLEVGSSTTDSTAIFFTLDKYNNGTDPAGVDGAMYYNTSLNKFRCYQNAAWTDCVLTPGSISQSLLASASNSIDIGSSGTTWRSGYFGTSLSSPVIRPAADGTTAFKLQNAGGTLDYLTLDTTNSRISIGVSDTTGTLLVLDTKTSAGDPTGVDGAMYYNSSMARFRCYESGAWKNCTGANPTNGSTATQGVTAGSDTYVTSSDLLLPTGGLQGSTSGATNGTKITWKVVMSKTAAGTAASTFTLRMGTNGTTADTSRCTFSTGTATADADGATVYITAYATAGGASSTLNCSMSLTHQLPSTGFSDAPIVQTYSTATSADSTTSGTKMGLSFNAGTSSVITIQSVEVTSTNL